MQLDMVFEGGGAKGMVFVGAMQTLEARGHTPARLIGTSAGAITAILLAAGYDSTEMQAALGERLPDGSPVFASFMDPPEREHFSEQDIENSLSMKLMSDVDIPLISKSREEWLDKKIMERLLNGRNYRTLFSFVERGGLYAGSAFLSWFERKLAEKKAAFAAMTLGQLHGATGRDVSVVATDTTARRLLVLNHRTAPNCPVLWAVRMSMSIPFAWQEVVWQANWDPYQELDGLGQQIATRDALAGHAIVDGGALSNFPINLLMSDQPGVRAVMGDADPNACPTVGLLIDETLEVPGAPPPPKEDEAEDSPAVDFKKLRTVRRVSALMDTMMAAHDKRNIVAHAEHICHLPAKDYGTMEFDMTEERRAKLIEAGAQAMRAHLDARGL